MMDVQNQVAGSHTSEKKREFKLFTLWCPWGQSGGQTEGHNYGHVTTKISRMDIKPKLIFFAMYVAPLACKNRKLGHLVLIDICTEHFFVALFPYAGDSTPLCLPSPCVFKMGTRLPGNILLGVSLWWTCTPSRGSSNTPRHCMLHAKETGISFGCLDLWPMCIITLLLNILNVILNLSKYQSQSPADSVKSTVWSLQFCSSLSSSADCEVCSLSSAFWGLQVEFCSLRSTVQGCALAEPGGPWRLTFALGQLENLRFFIQIICWAP